jgi:outer membrane protein insertion porin family
MARPNLPGSSESSPFFAAGPMNLFMFTAILSLSFPLGSAIAREPQTPSPAPSKQEPTLIVEEVVFEGAKTFTVDELKRQMRLVGEAGRLKRFGRRNRYTRESFQEDSDQLLKYMTDRGYLRASIEEPKIRFINSQDAARVEGDVPIRLIIPIIEGPLHKLGMLILQDGALLTPEEARAQFTLKTGEVINAGLMEETLNRLRTFYGRLGYLQFAPAIDFKFGPVVKNESVTDITITLNDGKRFIVGRIEFSGNRRTQDSPLRRMIPLNEGDVFDYARLEAGIERINRTGLFNPLKPADIVLEYDLPRSAANVELRLVERNVQRIDVSGGAGAVGAFNLGLDYAHSNLTGRLDAFNAQLRLGNLEQTVLGRYGVTLLTARPVSLSYTGSFQRFVFVDAQSQGQNRRPLYIQTSGGLSAGATIPIAKGRNTLAAATRASLFYAMSFNTLEDLAPVRASIIGGIQPSNIRLGSLTPALSHDTLERDFDPQHGTRLTIGVETTGRALGANLGLVKPWVDFRRFIPLNQGMLRGERNVFGFRLRASHVAAYGEAFQASSLSVINGTPIFQRFFVGGVTEVRGYPVNSISPLARVDRLLVAGNNPPVILNSNIQPIGGDTQLIANMEYRAPILKRLSAAAFFDFGASLNAHGLKEERFISPLRLSAPIDDASLITVVRPLEDVANQIPNYRLSLGVEARLMIPIANLPLRLIFSYNPNAQVNPPPFTLLSREKRFVFLIGFVRAL